MNSSSSPSLSWSSEQRAIFSFIASSSSNLIVEAVAGAGKSTTLREAIVHVPTKTNSLLPPAILVLSFDKATQEKMQTALGAKAVARTCSSLGLAALRTSFPKIKVDLKKAGNTIFPLFKRDHPDTRTALCALSLLKSCWPLLRASEASLFLQENDVDFEDEKSLGKVLRALEATLADTSACDFDDMLVMPLIHNCEFPKQDFVLVDEAQDTNDVQLEILTRLQKAGKVVPDDEGNPEQLPSSTRFLFVGDPSQAIYGFRGANSDSMERIKKRFACKSLPLSVTYRCPRLHVELARHYCNPTK